ncbi:MAG: hypothetical protein M3Y87_23105, partial [Myxococcota bacterium]|nr:hypothetical protein [Myxococcota bacterium]
MSERVAAPDGPKSPWLVSPVIDMMLGAGGIYIIIAVVLGAAGRADIVDPSMAACLALAIGGPHYGATLIRAYGTPQAREQFKSIGTYATAALLVAVIAALWVPIIGALIVTLYFTWVSYHYSAQSYGVTRMFLARRGIVIDDRMRSALQWMFTTSALLWVVSIHTELPGRLPTPPTELYPLLRLGAPLMVGGPLMIALGIALVGCAAYVTARLVAARSLEKALPAVVLTVGQMTWFALPVLAIRTGALSTLVPFATDSRASIFLFVALTHASQHLWVALHHAKKQNGGTEGTHFLRSLAAGSLVWGVPSLLLARGPVASEMGVAILIAGAVNVHHFALDGVVWKLRDPRNASLVRNTRAVTVPQRGGMLVAVGAAVLATQLIAVGIDRELGALGPYPDPDRVALIEPLAWLVGRDGPRLRSARLASEVAAGRCDE